MSRAIIELTEEEAQRLGNNVMPMNEDSPETMTGGPAYSRPGKLLRPEGTQGQEERRAGEDLDRDQRRPEGAGRVNNGLLHKD